MSIATESPLSASACSGLLAASLALIPGAATAQDGQLDSSFDGDGKLTVGFDLDSGGLGTDEIRGALVQPDGKIVLAGWADFAPGGDDDFASLRLQADGSADGTFGTCTTGDCTDGKGVTYFNIGSDYDDRAHDVALQSDGKIILVGDVSAATPGDVDFGITRLNANGTLDTTFGDLVADPGRTVVPFDRAGDNNDHARGVAVQADDKIVVVGAVKVGFFDDMDFGIARLTKDGALDTTFGGGNGKVIVSFDLGGNYVDWASDVAIQSDGKIVVAGRVAIQQGNFDFGIVRLDTDGTLDATFNLDGRSTVGFDRGPALERTDRAYGVAIQSDGKIVVAGDVEYGGGNFDFGVTRLLSNGYRDLEFGFLGRQTVAFDLGQDGRDRAFAVGLYDDGRIVVAGDIERLGPGDLDFGVVRLNRDGRPDPCFGKSFLGPGLSDVSFDLGANDADQAFALAIQPNGDLVVAGIAQTNSLDPSDFDFAVARLEGGSALLCDGFESGGLGAWSSAMSASP